MTDGTNPVIDGLLAEWKRLEDAFHDALPNQGETGDPTAGKAMCQFLYDNAPTLRAALTTRAAPPANPVIVERVARAIEAAMRAARLETTNDAWFQKVAQAALEAMPDEVGLREALEDGHSVLVKLKVARTLRVWAGAGGAADEVSRIVGKFRRALAKVSGVSKPLPDSPPGS